jgi:Putative prokaryotic signal transducing protein
VSDLVRVALVENEPSAELAVGYLRTEGIPAMWQGTSLGATSWGVTSVGGAVGPMEILVHPEHAERAEELLAERD